MFRCAVAIKQRASQERRTAELNGKVYLLVDKVVKGAFVMLGFSANQDGLHCLDDVTGLATGGEGERETPDLYLPPKQRVANGCDGLIRVQHGSIGAPGERKESFADGMPSGRSMTGTSPPRSKPCSEFLGRRLRHEKSIGGLRAK